LLVAGISVLALNLRAAITGLPPVFPELAASLHLSGAALAVLAATLPPSSTCPRTALTSGCRYSRTGASRRPPRSRRGRHRRP